MALVVNDRYFENQMAVLNAASTVDGELGKRLRESIFQELKAARNRIVSNIHFANGDPRETAKSVKRYTTHKYLGGIVSIAQNEKTGRRNSYTAPRKVFPGMKGHRGGNRVPRSQRTEDILTTADRGFILRFVNSGTIPRYSGGGRIELGKHSSARNFFKMQEEGTGYRGSIAPRNFFSTLGEPAMQQAVKNLETIINEEYEKVFK